MVRDPSPRPARRIAALVAAIVLLALVLASLFERGPAPGPASWRAEATDPVAGARGPVDLAVDLAGGRPEAPGEAVRAPAARLEPPDAAPPEAAGAPVPDRTVAAAPPLEEGRELRRVPVGTDGVVLAVEVLLSGYLLGPRVPAWLELDASFAESDGEPARRGTRRVLGVILGDTYRFEVGGLAPGPATLRVETGERAPIARSLRLEPGRNEVLLEPEREAAFVLELVTEVLFGEPRGRGGAEPVPLRVPGHPFGPTLPWIELVDAAGNSLACVPLRGPRAAREAGLEPVHRELLHVHGAAGATEARVVGGAPRDVAFSIEPFAGGARVVATAVEASSDVERLVLELELAGADPPSELVAVLHGSVPDLCCLERAPVRVERLVPVEGADGTPRATLALDALDVPRPVRLALLAPGCRPHFLDLDEAVASGGPLVLGFEPGSGGVVVGAYQNNRVDGGHWAPARGFDVEWVDAAEVPLARGRLGPLGYLELGSDEVHDFDAGRIRVERPERNLARTTRAIHPVLDLRTEPVPLGAASASGVVLLAVRD